MSKNFEGTKRASSTSPPRSTYSEDLQAENSTVSDEFLKMFLELLRCNYGTRRVKADEIYGKYVSLTEHVPLKDTKWENLRDFLKHLSKEGLCVVDEPLQLITYINRASDFDEKMKRKFSRTESPGAESSDTESSDTESSETEIFPPLPEVGHERPMIKFELKKKIKLNKCSLTSLLKHNSRNEKKKKEEKSRKKSNLQETMEFEQTVLLKNQERNCWIIPNIVVKITRGYFIGKEAFIHETEDSKAIIEVIENGTKFLIEQKYLDPVKPVVQDNVIILNGLYRGCSALVVKVEESSVSVKILSSAFDGKIIDTIKFKDVSKKYEV